MIRLATTLGIAMLFLSACGVKGGLQPRGKAVPAAPAVLVLQQQGDSILMNWDIPTRNQDGSPLTNLDGFRIDLYSYLPGSYCAECRDQQILAQIELASPGPARNIDDQIYFRQNDLALDKGYRYRVYPVTTGGKTGSPAEARRQMHRPPDAPENIRTEELDKGIRIFWEIPEGTLDRGDLAGVNIYRGVGQQPLKPGPINREPVSGNNFEEFGLQNAQLYRLGLRTVIRVGDDLVESALSTIIEATPKVGL